MCYACFIHRKVINHCFHDFVNSKTPQTNNFSEAVFLVLILDSVQHTNKTNDLILNLTPENVTQHSGIVTTTRKGSSTPTKMSKIIGRQIH